MGGENEVEYPTETMTTLANTKQTKWETDSTEGVKLIRDAIADAGSFGDIPELASYGAVFAEVRKIYLETMRGAKADLDAVAQGIKSSAQQMRDQDDNAGAAFLALWQRWESGPLASTANNEQASSTSTAQQAAETADTAETSSGVPADTETGETGPNPDTQSEGELPTTDTGDTPPEADDEPDTEPYDARDGQPDRPAY